MAETEQPMLRTVNEFESPLNQFAPREPFQIAKNSATSIVVDSGQKDNKPKTSQKSLKRSKTTNELTSLADG